MIRDYEQQMCRNKTIDMKMLRMCFKNCDVYMVVQMSATHATRIMIKTRQTTLPDTRFFPPTHFSRSRATASRMCTARSMSTMRCMYDRQTDRQTGSQTDRQTR